MKLKSFFFAFFPGVWTCEKEGKPDELGTERRSYGKINITISGIPPGLVFKSLLFNMSFGHRTYCINFRFIKTKKLNQKPFIYKI
jgi:hypothetical protein